MHTLGRYRVALCQFFRQPAPLLEAHQSLCAGQIANVPCNQLRNWSTSCPSQAGEADLLSRWQLRACCFAVQYFGVPVRDNESAIHTYSLLLQGSNLLEKSRQVYNHPIANDAQCILVQDA